MARLSPAYRAYHASAAWAEVKARHWANPLTLKSCVVCGARRRDRALDMHELLYRFRGRGQAQVELDPPWWGIVPACARPCHRWLITPLSHHRWIRWVLFAGLAALALFLGAPILWTAGAVALLLALPRIPEATALCALLGLPVRVFRWIGRLARRVLR